MHDVICAVDGVVPWAAVPMVVAREIHDPGTGDVEGDILVVGELVEEMTGVSAFVAAGAIVGAAHVGAHAEALDGPMLPLAIGVEADGDRRWFDC